MGSDGYLLLSDYGLAKKIETGDEVKGTFCGTIDYIAPEILNFEKYGKSVDWWSVGILTYELIIGFPPFQQKEDEPNIN